MEWPAWWWTPWYVLSCWSNQEEQGDRSVHHCSHVEERIIVKLRTNVTGKYGGKNIFKMAGSCEHNNAHPDCIIDSGILCQLNNCQLLKVNCFVKLTQTGNDGACNIHIFLGYSSKRKMRFVRWQFCKFNRHTWLRHYRRTSNVKDCTHVELL